MPCRCASLYVRTDVPVDPTKPWNRSDTPRRSRFFVADDVSLSLSYHRTAVRRPNYGSPWLHSRCLCSFVAALLTTLPGTWNHVHHVPRLMFTIRHGSTVSPSPMSCLVASVTRAVRADVRSSSRACGPGRPHTLYRHLTTWEVRMP